MMSYIVFYGSLKLLKVFDEAQLIPQIYLAIKEILTCSIFLKLNPPSDLLEYNQSLFNKWIFFLLAV